MQDNHRAAFRQLFDSREHKGFRADEHTNLLDRCVIIPRLEEACFGPVTGPRPGAPSEGKRRRRLLSTSVLITGGAGFIGSALSRRLVKAGYEVAVMDVLHPQVHGECPEIDLPPSVRLFTGDVTHAPDCDAVLRLFRPSQIVHLAAETGTAQSLSESTRHGSVTWWERLNFLMP